MSILFDTIVIKRTVNNNTYVPINLNELQLWIGNTNVLPSRTGSSNNDDGQSLGSTPEFYRNSTKQTVSDLNGSVKAENIAGKNISTSSYTVHSKRLNQITGNKRAISLYIPLVKSSSTTDPQSYDIQKISYVVLYNTRNDNRDRTKNLRIEFYNRSLDSTLSYVLAHTDTIDTEHDRYRWEFNGSSNYTNGFATGNSTSKVTKNAMIFDNITYLSDNWLTISPNLPSPPTNISAHPLSSTSIDISFTESTTGADSYTATSGDISGTSTESPITINDLSAGESYTFEVFATNTNGDSSNSEISITLPPSPPKNVSAQLKSNNSIDISFTESTTGATEYTATSGDISGTSTGSPITITGLTSGQSYTFAVVASDISNGDSGPNPEVSITIPPSPPTNISAQPFSSTSVIISFTESVGATEYTATSSPDDISGTSSESPIVINGLSTGETYTFTVVASNVGGESTASSVSSSITLPSFTPLFDTIVIRRINGNSTSDTGNVLNFRELQLWVNGSNILPSSTSSSKNDDGDPLGNTIEFIDNDSNLTQSANNTNDIASNIANGGASGDFDVHSPILRLGDPFTALYIPLDISMNYNNIQSLVLYNRTAPTWKDRVQGIRIELYNREIDNSLSTPLVYTNTIESTYDVYRYDFLSIDSYPDASFVTGISTSNITSSATTSDDITYNIGNWFTAFPEYAAPPSPPTNISAHPLSSTSVIISFTESTGATNYTATSGDISDSSGGSPIIINDLTAGETYTFIVVASDSNGDSGPNPEVSITLPPSPPTNVSAQLKSNNSIDISFTESTTGADNYTATSGDISGTSSTSPITITGLTSGQSYTFIVVASDSNGDSGPNPEVSITLSPSPPTNISAQPLSSTSVIISFTESTGADSYTATSSPGDISDSSGGSPIIINGLTAGESYTFTVVATNTNGDLASSSSSSYITLPRNYITERNAVRFNVYNSTANYYIAGNILPFDKIDFNIGGSYDTTTYKYTFLKGGTYLIGLSYTREGFAGSVYHRLLRKGVVSTIRNTISPNGNTINSCYIYRFQVDDVIYHEVHEGEPAMNDVNVPDGDIYNSWWGIRLNYD